MLVGAQRQGQVGHLPAGLHPAQVAPGPVRGRVGRRGVHRLGQVGRAELAVAEGTLRGGGGGSAGRGDHPGSGEEVVARERERELLLKVADGITNDPGSGKGRREVFWGIKAVLCIHGRRR